MAVLPLLLLAVGGFTAFAQEVVQPEIVVPGQWMTDAKEKFLFLPLTIPEKMPLKQCKLFSNGMSILVVVTETPEEEPETKAMQKYKLVVDAIKDEAAHDEKLLKQKLQTWYETEDDDEVKVHVKAALDSLTKVRSIKNNHEPRTVSVPMGMLVQEARSVVNGKLLPAPLPGQKVATSFLQRALTRRAHNNTVAKEVDQAEHALTALHKATSTTKEGKQASLKVGLIKESFAVEIPYPVDTEQVFMLVSKPDTLMITMPFVEHSLEAKGISTGGKPFSRLPVFDMQGVQVAGPTQSNGLAMSIAEGVHPEHLAAAKSNLKPLGTFL